MPSQLIDTWRKRTQDFLNSDDIACQPKLLNVLTMTKSINHLFFVPNLPFVDGTDFTIAFLLVAISGYHGLYSSSILTNQSAILELSTHQIYSAVVQHCMASIFHKEPVIYGNLLDYFGLWC